MERTERWKPIPGFPGYKASTSGRLSGPEGLLKPDKRGRIKIKGSRHAIAYWVLVTFRGPPKRPYGNRKGCHLSRHLDDDRTNNKLENLAWGTQKENMADARRNGKREFTPSWLAKIGRATRSRWRTLTPTQQAKATRGLKQYQVGGG